MDQAVCGVQVLLVYSLGFSCVDMEESTKRWTGLAEVCSGQSQREEEGEGTRGVGGSGTLGPCCSWDIGQVQVYQRKTWI